MEFGERPTDQAEGAILAHSVRLPAGRIRKGKVLTAEDISLIRAAGLTTVTVARLSPTDVHEDQAALTLARAVVPDPEAAGLILRPVGTGRVNIISSGPGLAEIRAGRIHALNATDPMITVATVPPWQRMAGGGMVATIKIIAYGVPGAALDRACAAGRNALLLRAPCLRSLALICTVTGAPESEKGRLAVAARVRRLGADLRQLPDVRHDAATLATALLTAADQGAEAILILTGSATSDAQDTAPSALRLAGGTLHHFGMPVDPGNLLFIGDLRGRPVIGLPGCARSPALNGADWVLERVICGVPVTGRDISAMGVGGLLKEIPERPRPRDA